MSASDSVTLHLLISGRVQGVGYRAWVLRTARKAGLMGWVRNLTDGRVEAVACGPKSAIDHFVGACHAGPLLARVTAVDTKVVAAPESFMNFEQRETVAPRSDV